MFIENRFSSLRPGGWRTAAGLFFSLPPRHEGIEGHKENSDSWCLRVLVAVSLAKATIHVEKAKTAHPARFHFIDFEKKSDLRKKTAISEIVLRLAHIRGKEKQSTLIVDAYGYLNLV